MFLMEFGLLFPLGCFGSHSERLWKLMETFYALKTRHQAKVFEILLAKLLKMFGEYVKIK